MLGRFRKNARGRELERASATFWPLCGAQDDHAIQGVIGYDAFSTFVAGRHEEMSLLGPDLVVQPRWHAHALEAARQTAFAEDFHPVGSPADDHKAAVHLADALVDLTEERLPWQITGDGWTPPSK